MSRIHKLENIYKEQLINRKVNDVSHFIQSVVDADVTKGKYARFLIEAFLNDKFLEEDLIGGVNSTVGQAISLFDKHKSKLPLEHRSVYALNSETGEALYQSPGDLWNSVKQYQGELSGKELKREEQEKIYRETEFVYKDEETGFQIISPLTEQSAKWWGKGTRWCTSADHNNMFWDYANEAPLLVLLMPASASTAGNGQKLQLWKYEDNIQFMDEADNSISRDYIKEHWNILKPICLWLNNLYYIPEDLKTPELCEMAVQQYGLALYYVPEKFITPQLCETAIKQNGMSIEWIPEKLITKELCELAVKKDGMTLEFVPEELRTEELCKLAVKQNGWSLRFVPQKLRTPELCELAIKQNRSSLQYVPDELRTKELCLEAVKHNGENLNVVPNNFRTKELCEIAVKQSIYAIMSVPEELRTKELCELAVRSNKDAFRYIPRTYKTKEICELAVKQNGYFLNLVPEEFRTKELCEIAVKQDGTSLQHVPHAYKTPELCKLAIEQNGKSLEWVPYKLTTKELYELAVQNNENALHSVPDRHQIPMDKYKEAFQGIKTFFPKKDISLSYHHL